MRFIGGFCCTCLYSVPPDSHVFIECWDKRLLGEISVKNQYFTLCYTKQFKDSILADKSFQQ